MYMKNIIVGIVVFFLTLFVYTKLGGPLPLSMTSTTTTKTDIFTVTGEGKTTVTPNIAKTTIGVQTSGATVKQTQADLNTAINQVTSAVKKVGIADKDLKTSGYSIYPTYDYTNAKQRITGYHASTNLTIIIRNLDAVNAVIDAATANGANTVSGITFDVEDKTKAEDEARKIAVASAKRHAEIAAKAAGFTLGNIVNYQESFSGNVDRSIYMMAKVPMAGGGTAEDTQIEPGSNELSISVTLQYQIR